jgi:hypothetical protein
VASAAVLAWLLPALVGCDRRPAQEGPATPEVADADLVRTAQRGPVKLKVRIDRAELTIPEELTLTVAVESEIGVEVSLPELGETMGAFGVAGFSEAEPVSDDLIIRRERTYTLESFAPGAQSVPAIAVAFADRREKADGSHTVYADEVTTEPIAVTVRPGLADVKGPVAVPMPGWQKLLTWVIGAIAAMVGIALLARWWRRRRRRAEEQLPKALRIVAHEWALAELDMLAAEDLIGRGLFQEFYYRINGLLRRYIELRYGLMAGEQTSEEFIRALQDAAFLEENHKQVLRRFVEACDPVKYARHRPEPDEIDWVQTSARDFVLETAENASDRGKEPPALAGGRPPKDRPATSRASSGAPSALREDAE